ncbi:MAG: cobalamin-dependent protein [Elusimicrobia bacterium]|nr:cobalamin-dependent protein [Elusimicrobiota bacterium]
MDILLINPYSEISSGTNETTVEVPVGLLNLAAFLETKNIKVDILDAYAIQLPQHSVMEIIKKSPPKVVGITVNAFSFVQAISYTEEIKKISKDIIIIWGGPQPTITTEICFKKSNVDFIVVGEGEFTLLEIMKNILNKENVEHIKGLAYRQGNNFKINLPRERIIDLDSLPLPAYHLLPDFKYYKTRARKRPFMGIITSRGCPFNCIYCSKDVFKTKVTMRSPESIIKELDILVNKYGIRQIDIEAYPLY